ncbi:conserved exported hypothetical protein [Candidatus Desulfarcum epimagneticum]|uniref:Uncharacterized protein n=1 Tax=uncultured Desulfobacteraceae bacterium TaxID=218296 RepID=A0A484HI48_9BACT|nr:conserved exported hypothetical protein [uncultured Desulfobacteraceae bacterium]
MTNFRKALATLAACAAVFFFAPAGGPGPARGEIPDPGIISGAHPQEKRATGKETPDSPQTEEEILDIPTPREAPPKSGPDRLFFEFKIKTGCDSIHYSDVRQSPDWFLDAFSRDGSSFYDSFLKNKNFDGVQDTLRAWVETKKSFQNFFSSQEFGGFDGLPTDSAGFLRRAVAEYLKNPDLGADMAGTYTAGAGDSDGHAFWTSEFRMAMRAEIKPNLRFSGRLAMRKAFGDSPSLTIDSGDVFVDSNPAGPARGDFIRLEQAFFTHQTKIGSAPIRFSLGRRPDPFEYGDGAPLADMIHIPFDGASLAFLMGDQADMPGLEFKLFYGAGFDNQWGAGFSLGHDSGSVDGPSFGGATATLDAGETARVVLNYARAWNITDSFSDAAILPFAVTGGPNIDIRDNRAKAVTRLEPVSRIGDVDLATLLIQSRFPAFFAKDRDIDLFAAFSWSHTEPSGFSQNPLYKFLGAGLLCNDELKSRDGYSVYAGTVFPAFGDDRAGIEFNWGSQYWLSMTGDSPGAGKLSARGHVLEGYYIHKPFSDRHMFLTLGARHYGYQYTLSGNPLGEPVKISQSTLMDALFPSPETVWEYYVSLTFQF